MTAAKVKSAPPEASANGQPTGDTLAGAIAQEKAIADEAAGIWGDAAAMELTPELFMRLRELLRRPIPAAFIEEVGEVTGKPYESTGIKSVQVQIDRMDNVLGATNWDYGEPEYFEDGKLCKVTVTVHVVGKPVRRWSYGGVNRGSTIGNVWKGSFTNAAKLALARVGPGWEIYIGAADFDPDTDEAAAKAQERSGGETVPAVERIAADRVAHLMEAFQAVPREGETADADLKRELKLKLGSIGVSATGIGAAFAKLTPAQADEIDTWITEQNGGGS